MTDGMDRQTGRFLTKMRDAAMSYLCFLQKSSFRLPERLLFVRHGRTLAQSRVPCHVRIPPSVGLILYITLSAQGKAGDGFLWAYSAPNVRSKNSLVSVMCCSISVWRCLAPACQSSVV
jgi:hypothetical protein